MKLHEAVHFIALFSLIRLCPTGQYSEKSLLSLAIHWKLQGMLCFRWHFQDSTWVMTWILWFTRRDISITFFSGGSQAKVQTRFKIENLKALGLYINAPRSSEVLGVFWTFQHYDGHCYPQTQDLDFKILNGGQGLLQGSERTIEALSPGWNQQRHAVNWTLLRVTSLLLWAESMQTNGTCWPDWPHWAPHITAIPAGCTR